MIRPATSADVTAVTELERDLFGPDAWSAASVEAGLTGTRRCALVAERDGHVVGYAVCSHAGDDVDLDRVAVAPAHRRSGVATSLVGALRGFAVAVGAGRMLLEVSEGNHAARSFYAAAGFAEVGRRRRYYRDGTDALVLAARPAAWPGQGVAG